MRTVAAAIDSVAARADPLALRLGCRSVLSVTAYAGTRTLLILAPFELSRPLIRLPWQSVSSVEALLAATFGACAIAAVFDQQGELGPKGPGLQGWLRGPKDPGLRRWRVLRLRARTPLTWPWLALVVAMLVSALMSAPDIRAERINAEHMVGRVAIAFGVFVVAVNGINSPARLRGALNAALIGGCAVAVLAILEYWGVGPARRFLQLFRPAVTSVGSQVRAGGSLQYPTIASMYLETVFALTLGLLVLVSDRPESAVPGRAASRHRVLVMTGLMLALAMVSEAIVLTFTRAGLITIAVSLGVVGVARARRLGPFDPGDHRGVDPVLKAIAGLTVIVAIQLLASRSLEAMRLRLTTESQEAWYRFSIDAPQQLTLASGGRTTVPVTIRNLGQVTWDSDAYQPFSVSFHWLLADADRVVSYEGLRTPFPVPVPAGASVSLPVRVEAPREPGRYRLMWDVAQENHLWFSTEPGATPVFSQATVTGRSVAPIESSRLAWLPRPTERPGRFVLWQAAARMLAAHPLLGVGPDNFRLEYGAYAGLKNADTRVHSNNMYIEVLAGGGLLAGAAFTWMLWVGARLIGQLVAIGGMGLGVAAALVAIAIHGLVDSFVSFTPTYVLIALTLGIAVAITSQPETTDANRV